MNTVLMSDGGLQTVLPLQVIYLDFDGANTAYHGEALTIEGVTVQNSGLTAAQITSLTDQLNESYLGNVRFVTERPESGDYSTVYVGATDAFTYHGLAETIDAGNQNHNDNAFVNLRGDESMTTIQEIISHEVNHLLGTLDHGGDGLAAYGYRYDVSSGVTSTSIGLGGGDSMCVSSGGVAKRISIYGGSMSILSSGVANSTRVNSDGNIYIFSGGTANSTTLNSNGFMSIFSGGWANSTILNYDGFMSIFSGGVANNTIASWGAMTISSSGIASNTTVDNGSMYILGGVANNTTVNNGGNIYIFSGGAANNTTVNYNGTMYISSGGTANRTTVNSYGTMYISSDGTANSTTVNSYGGISIDSSGVANSTTVNSHGSMCISSGGAANNTTINSGGSMSIVFGGTANSTTVNSGGYMFVSSGGSAINVIWTPFAGKVYVDDGAYVTYLQNNSGCYLGSEDQLQSQAMTMTGKVVSGSMYVFSGGVADSTTITGMGLMYISSGGIANRTTMSNGFIYISSGGEANNTTVSGGEMYISGGVANDTIVSNGNLYIISSIINNTTMFGGGIDISSGCIVNGIVNNGGWMQISSGGVANSTTVNSNGYMYIFSGGVTNSTTVNSNGYMYISSGGSALNVIWTPCIGTVSVADGAYVTYQSNYSGCYFGSDNQLQSQAMTMTGKVVSGSMYVFSGGVANSNTVNSYGQMQIFSGGTASYTAINSRGYMSVDSGGSALNVIWTPCVGEVFAANGAYVTYQSNYSGCYFGSDNQLQSQAMTMTGKVISGSMYVFSGGVANSNTVDLMGSMVISSGGTANNTTVNRWGNLFISSGGIANNTTVNSYGHMYIFSGGIASSSTVNSDGFMTISSGGVANNTTAFWGAMTISSGGIASNTTVELCGSMYIFGGTANNTTVNNGGNIYIFSGGTANNTTVNYNGTIYISSGGTASRATVNSSGFMTVSSGGIANSTTVNSYGSMLISSGGVANNTMVSQGSIAISLGGVANTTTVNSNGNIYISSGGIASNTTVNSYGSMTILSGGKTTGNLTIAAGAVVSAYTGAEINFDVTGRTASDGYLINNLSLISGAPDYTITVSATPSLGIYKLAQGVGDFNQSISIGNGTNNFGDLFANGTAVQYGDYEYSLLQNSGNLSLSIILSDKIAPTITSIKASPTEPTNQNVLVSAVFADNMALALSQYKIGEGNWTNYTGAITVSSNATVYFKAIDTSGNEATAEYEVKNILAVDSKGPGAVTPVAKVNKYDATVSWLAPATQDKAKIVSYDVYVNGQLTFTKGTSLSLKAMPISTGNTVQVRALDSLGRYGALSNIITFDVKDVTAPTLGKVTTSLDQYTATVSYSGIDNVGVDHYQVKCGGQTQILAGTSATFDNLAIGFNNVEVIAYDAAGNASKAATAKITVKDVTAPDEVTGLADPTVDSKYKATLSWSAGVDNSGSVASYEIQLDNGKILKSTKNTLAINNLAVGQHSYQVRAIDKAKNVGEWSAAKAFTVLDTTAPGTVSAKAVVAQNSILLSWKASKDNVGVTGYQVWIGASPSTMTMEQALSADQSNCVLSSVPKGIYYMDVRAIDAANNASVSKPAKVTVTTSLPVNNFATSAPSSDLLAWSATTQTPFALASGL